MNKWLSLLVLLAAPCLAAAAPDASRHGNGNGDAVPGDAVPSLDGLTLVQDGGFEAGFVPTYWAQTSTNFGTPVCDASCGGVGPRTGTFWGWFGGAGTAAEAGSLQQVGGIATGPARLNFYLWWSSSVSTPPDPSAFFNVKIDGNTIFSLTPATAGPYSTAYTLASVDIAAYADGNTHTLRFESSNAASSGATNIHLDDISISGDTIFGDGFD